MDNIIVNRVSFDDIVSGLEDADDRFYFLRFLVAVVVGVLKRIRVQDGRESNVQDLQFMSQENISKR